MNEKVKQWLTKQWKEFQREIRKEKPGIKTWEIEELFLEDMQLLIQSQITFETSDDEFI